MNKITLTSLLIMLLSGCKTIHLDNKSKHISLQNITTEEKVRKRDEFEKGYYASVFEFSKESDYTKGIVLNAIGTMFHFGYGVNPDYTRAKDLYEKALKYGNGEAANHLGRMYNNGEGVFVNPKKAAEYYIIGCEKGHKDSCINCRNISKKILPKTKCLNLTD